MQRKLSLHIGVSKIKKYAASESGDTLEFIERPGGGLSIVLADGQRSGKSAKRISNMVVRKVISLLADGVRDGAAARAASDYLFHQRGGKVMGTLNIISVDLVSNTIVITRNNPAPVLIVQDGLVEVLDEVSQPVGIYRDTRPVIREVPLRENMTLLVFTDGITNAGVRTGRTLDPKAALLEAVAGGQSAEEIAGSLLTQALVLDSGRPVDDISVVALQVTENHDDAEVRNISVQIPF